MNETVSRSLAPRARRVRDRCFESLAGRRSLPIPGAGDVAQFGDEVGLGDMLAKWETMHTPPRAGAAVAGTPPHRVPRWRSPAVERPVLLALVAVLGFVVGDRWLLSAQAQPATAIPDVRWMAVTDSVIAALNGKLVQLGQADLALPVTLSPEEAAHLVFRNARVDSLEARVDSTLWMRGRVRGGARFEVEGDLSVAHAGAGELRVARLWLDGAPASTAAVSWSIFGNRAPRPDSATIRFPMPSFITRVGITGSQAEMVARLR